ncbi:colicin-like pore-forming protein [Yersinia alsatica]|uniref:colicin-like pore-forming protein n=1 Tax=Yersinia alsatica TaxID=2890317 RepID=UPI0011A4EA73|nr:colicin-like pore-forming protein [Yersinia alsatica]
MGQEDSMSVTGNPGSGVNWGGNGGNGNNGGNGSNNAGVDRVAYYVNGIPYTVDGEIIIIITNPMDVPTGVPIPAPGNYQVPVGGGFFYEVAVNDRYIITGVTTYPITNNNGYILVNEEKRKNIAREKIDNILAPKRIELERFEAEEKLRKEAEEKARKEAEEKARKEAEEKARKEAIEEKNRIRAEEEAKAKAEKESLIASASVLTDIMKEISAKYGDYMFDIAENLKYDMHVQGKKIRSYKEALETFETVRSNPKFHLNSQDKDIMRKALEALDVNTFADNVKRLSKTFGIAGRTIQLSSVIDKVSVGVETGDWKPLALEFESIIVGEVAVIAIGMILTILFGFLATLGFTVPAMLGFIITALIMAFTAAFFSTQRVEEINNLIFGKKAPAMSIPIDSVH